MNANKAILLKLDVKEDEYKFPGTISEALIDATDELYVLEEQLNETLETIKVLTLECDKYDYILSASSGA